MSAAAPPVSGVAWGRALDRVTVRVTASVERHRYVVLVVYSLALLAVLGAHAGAKPFWHDEIYTIVMADQPSIGMLWRSALDGLDSAPPLNALLTRMVHRVLGSGLLLTRLPALLGFWAASLIVFHLIRARASAVAGLCGVLILFFSRARLFADDARPYGLMIALFAAVLLAWSEAAAGRRRRVWVPVLAVLLAASLWNHYYAALTFLPLAAGEAVRAARDRRIDWAVALAFAPAVLALLPLLPHLRLVVDSAPTYYQRAALHDLSPVIRTLLDWLVLKRFLLVFLLVAGVLIGGAPAVAPLSGSRMRLPAYEVACGLIGTAIPCIGLTLGVFVTGVFLPRYGLPAVVSLALCAPLGVAARPRAGDAAALVLAIGLSAGFALQVFQTATSARSGFASPLDARPRLAADLRDRTLVVMSDWRYLNIWYYAPPELRPYFLCVVDPAAAVRFTGGDSVDRDYLVLRRWSGVDIRDYRTLVAATRAFRVYADPGEDWLVRQLQQDGARLAPVGREGTFDIYDVSTDAASFGERRP